MRDRDRVELDARPGPCELKLQMRAADDDPAAEDGGAPRWQPEDLVLKFYRTTESRLGNCHASDDHGDEIELSMDVLGALHWT
jgi:hypothetical protein